MFCSHCGKKIAKGAKFCATCGHEVEDAHEQPKRVEEASSGYSDTQTPDSVSGLTAKPTTNRKLLFGLGGVVLGVALLLLILLLSGVLTTASTYEGRGFATPEDAAIAYLTGLKEQNLKKMISAFAIESLVDHYDFEALLLRLRVYVSDSFEIKQYDVTPEIAKSWIWHYSGHNYNYRMHYRMQKRGHIMLNKTSIRTIGIDVHKDSFSLCTYCPETNSFVGEITTTSSSKMVANYIKRLQKDVGPNVSVISGYEAGPTGFGLHRDLSKAGLDCKVMAPTTIYEKKGGNRVKTDRGDYDQTFFS